MQKKILWVLFFHQVEKMFSYFQNHTGRMIFLKMVSNFSVLEGIFEAKFQGWFFFFIRIICKGISFVNWRWVQFFWWTFLLVRFIFKVISYIILCKIELSPKGDRKKFKTISYVKLKMSSMSKFRIFMVDGVPEGSQDKKTKINSIYT